MKTCECGGKWYRHGKTVSKRLGEGFRYICKDCKKVIHVREGRIVSGAERTIKDWRHEL